MKVLFAEFPLTNQQRGEGASHRGAGEHDDGDHVAHEAEERDGRQQNAGCHELEHLELERRASRHNNKICTPSWGFRGRCAVKLLLLTSTFC